MLVLPDSEGHPVRISTDGRTVIDGANEIVALTLWRQRF
jgi:hypothetical protein